MNAVSKRPRRAGREPVEGWAISIATYQMEGGEPVWKLYGATGADRDEVIHRVAAWLGYLPWDGFGEAWPLSSATVACLRRELGDPWEF